MKIPYGMITVITLIISGLSALIAIWTYNPNIEQINTPALLFSYIAILSLISTIISSCLWVVEWCKDYN